MTQQEILNGFGSKTYKMRALFELGLSRREVAELLGVGYGFAQNVYAAAYPDRIGARRERPGFSFLFNRNFGVEIEAFGVSRDRLELKLNELGITTRSEGYNHITREYWKIVSDASVRGENAFEIVSPVLNGEDGLQQLEKVCTALKSLKAKINKTCGLHIHLEAKDYKISAWKNLYLNYATLEPTIDTFMPDSRRGNNNQYCKSILRADIGVQLRNASTLRAIERAITSGSRYYKLNTQSYWKYKTIEFRQHSGTIEFAKISNWIKLLARMVEYSKKNTTGGGWEGIEKFSTPELKNYFKERADALAA